MRKETKFTPGPWVVDPEYPSDIQSGDGSFEIARALDDSMYDKTAVYRESMPPFEEAEANAALIAQAPILYEELEKADKAIDDIIDFLEILTPDKNQSEEMKAARENVMQASANRKKVLALARGEKTDQ